LAKASSVGAKTVKGPSPFSVSTRPAAYGMAVLMLGAIVMHFKVKDPLKKSLPAFTMLLLSLIVTFI